MLSSSFAQVRLPCDNSFYISVQGNASSKIVQGEITPNGPQFTRVIGEFSGRQIGPLGYSIQDGHLYALDVGNLSLVRIDSTGNMVTLADFSDALPSDLVYTMGVMGPTGRRFSFMGHRPSDVRDLTLYSTRVDRASSPGQSAIINQLPVYITAAAYSPAFGIIYGFDENRPGLVQIGSGLASSYNYAGLGNTSMGALFFDSENRLWGYGNPSGFTGTQFFGIDIGTGEAFPLQSGQYSGIVDGCSCPYRITVEKEFSADTLTRCDTLELTYRIDSRAGFIYQDLSLRDTLPPGLEILETVATPTATDVVWGANGAIELDIRFLDLNRNELTFKVAIRDGFAGEWASQAVLDSLPWGLGTVIRSDQPRTPEVGDVSRFVLQPLGVAVGGDTLLCPGGSGTLTAQVLPRGTRATVFWEDGPRSATRSVDAPGWYVAVAIQACDTVRDSIFVERVPYTLEADLGPDRFIQQGESVQLSLQQNAPQLLSIIWSSDPATDFSCPACPNPQLTPLQPTEVRVDLLDEFGCAASDVVRIEVDTTRGLQFFNVFTPNGDDRNDYFYVAAEGRGTIRLMQVYDRWGRVMYEGQNLPFNQPEVGWNGDYRGQAADEGTYFWRVDIEFPDGGQFQRRGTLTLLR